MKIARDALEAIRAHGVEGYPEEICGFLIGRRGDAVVTRVRRARNIVGEPGAEWTLGAERRRDRYQIDPRDQFDVDKELRDSEFDVVGYYHSHPDHEAIASKTDADRSYAGYVYVIVSVVNGVARDANAFVAAEDHGDFHLEPIEVV